MGVPTVNFCTHHGLEGPERSNEVVKRSLHHGLEAFGQICRSVSQDNVIAHQQVASPVGRVAVLTAGVHNLGGVCVGKVNRMKTLNPAHTLPAAIPLLPFFLPLSTHTLPLSLFPSLLSTPLSSPPSLPPSPPLSLPTCMA